MKATIDRDAAFWSLRATAERLAGIVARTDRSRKVPHLVWTVGHVAAHVVDETRMHAGLARGVPSPIQDLDSDYRDKYTQARAEQVLAEEDDVARAVVDATADAVEAYSAVPPGETIVWEGGAPMSVEAVLSIMLAELLLHGWDVTRATGDRWEISRKDALLALASAPELVPAFVDPGSAAGFHGAFHVHLRGGPRYSISFDDGQVTMGAWRAGSRADCRISADPSAFLLMAYGRGSLWTPVLTGKVVALGRKPWLGLKFPTLMRRP